MPPPDESDFTEAAPYGQACSNCSRAKAKCMRRPVGQGPSRCERCHRRGLECESTSRTRRKPRRDRISHTAQLEAKLDSLVSLLQSSRPSNPPASEPPHPHPAAHQHFPRAPVEPPTTSVSADTGSCPSSPTQPTAWSTDISDQEADECFGRFCLKLLHFPFIYIPPSETAATLRRDRPILWQCILAVSTKSMSRRQALGSRLRSVFADRLIVQHERSIDLLLGLLAFMGWANYQLAPQQLFMGMYCHLLAGLVQDLGLDQQKGHEEQHPMACLKPQGLVMRLTGAMAYTTEARRAAIATFVITSEIMSFRALVCQRIADGLKWTPLMDEHVQALDRAQESPLDSVLLHMARLKLIGNEATRSIHTYSPHPPSDRLWTLQVFQAHSLQQQLQKLADDVPGHGDFADILRLHTINTELEIHEISLYQMQPKGALTPDPDRIAMLSTCVQASRSWFDVFFRIDPEAYSLFGFATWAQLSHLVLSVYRLTMLNEAWWDRDLVTRTIDLNQVLDQMLNQTTSASQAAASGGSPNDREMAFYPVRSIKALKAAWGPLLAPKPTGQATADAGGFNLEGLDGANTMADLGAGLPVDDGLEGWMDMFTTAWMYGDASMA